MTARSGRPDALIPTAVAPATNPPGIAARRSTAGRTGGGAEVAGAGAEPAADVAVIVVGYGAHGSCSRPAGPRQAAAQVEGPDPPAPAPPSEVFLDPQAR